MRKSRTGFLAVSLIAAVRTIASVDVTWAADTCHGSPNALGTSRVMALENLRLLEEERVIEHVAELAPLSNALSAVLQFGREDTSSAEICSPPRLRSGEKAQGPTGCPRCSA
jgi:hypothetical protein